LKRIIPFFETYGLPVQNHDPLFVKKQEALPRGRASFYLISIDALA